MGERVIVADVSGKIEKGRSKRGWVGKKHQALFGNIKVGNNAVEEND